MHKHPSNMKIEVTDVSDTYIKFVLKDTAVSYANALRRILISEVPSVTIDLVEIIKNNTAFPDEMLSQRLGLMPIYTKKDLVFKDECECTDFCDSCSVDLSLDVSNTNDTPLLVTCKDLKINSDEFSIKSNPIICKLGKNQSIKIQCKAYKGIGLVHSKWSPVSAISFDYDDDSTHCTTVRMCVEVVEGFGKPKDILEKGLKLLANKLHNLKNDLIV